MPKEQLIILKFQGDARQAGELQEALEILMKHAAISQLATLAKAVKKNPKLIENAIRFVQ